MRSLTRGNLVRLVALSGLLICSVALVLLFFWIRKPSRFGDPVRLADGSVLELRHASFGKENWYHTENAVSKLIHLLRGGEYFNWQFGGIELCSPNSVVFHVEPDALVFWFEVSTKRQKVEFLEDVREHVRIVTSTSSGERRTNHVQARVFEKNRPRVLALYVPELTATNDVHLSILELQSGGFRVAYEGTVAITEGREERHSTFQSKTRAPGMYVSSPVNRLTVVKFFQQNKTRLPSWLMKRD